MQVYEEFKDLLSQENALIEQLITLGTQKKDLMNNAEQVAILASQEQSLVEELEKLERERITLFDVMAPGQSLLDWLSQDTPDSRSLEPEARRLLGNFQILRDIHELNKQLLQESLNFVQFSLSLLVDETPKTYARGGAASQTKSIFDRKV